MYKYVAIPILNITNSPTICLVLKEVIYFFNFSAIMYTTCISIGTQTGKPKSFY